MTDFDLVWDSDAGRLKGEDPETGETVPIPLDDVEASNLDVGGSVNADGADIGEYSLDYNDEGEVLEVRFTGE